MRKRQQNKSIKSINWNKFNVIAAIVIGLVTLIIMVKQCQTPREIEREKVKERNKNAVEKHVKGEGSELQKIQYQICENIIQNTFCPINIKPIDETNLDDISDQQLKHCLREFYAKIRTYNIGCREKNNEEKKDDVYYFYLWSKEPVPCGVILAKMSESYSRILEECDTRLQKKKFKN